MSKTLFALLISLIWLSASAEQQDTTYLQEVVITANRSERSLDEVSRSVSVIGRDRIEKLSYQNVAELLDKEAGIYIVGQGQNPGTNQSLFLRGANSNHVNILVDGVRLSDPSTPGGSLDLSELSLTNVEQIEILRGSHGTMYGTSGIGGVINIITKKAEKGWSLDLMAQGGLFDESGQSLSHSIKGRYQFENGLYAAAGYQQLNVNGLDAARDTAQSDGLYSDQDDFEKMDYFGQIGYQGSKLGVNAFFKNIDQKADLDQGAFDDDDNYYLELDRKLLNYQINYELKDGSISYLGGWSRLTRATDNDSSLVDTNGNYDGIVSKTGNTGETLTNELQYLFTNGPISILVGAGQYREQMNLSSYTYLSGMFAYESSSNLDSLDIQADTYYGFSQVVITGEQISKALSSWNLTIGGRYTNHSLFGGRFSYEISPAYVFDNGKAYLSLSSGYKNPSLTQLFDPAFTPGYISNRGNENLNPEISRSLEIGWNQQLGSFELNLSLYQNYIQDVIEYVYLWDASSKEISALDFGDYRGDTYINLTSMQTYGIEVGINWQIGSRLNISGNYSYLKGTLEFDSNELPDELETSYVQLFNNGQFVNNEQFDEESLVRRPSNLVNLRLGYDATQKLNIGLSYRYVDSRNDSFYDPSLGPFGALNTLEVNAYHLVDANVSYELGNLLMAFRVENMLNSDYREIQGFNTRGRGFYLKAQYKILSGK